MILRIPWRPRSPAAAAPADGARIALLWVALAGFAVLAADSRLYWHDVRYLYATAHYSLADLFAGEWDPQYGQLLDPAASGAFYLAKWTLLAGMETWWWLWPPESGGLEAAILISLGLTAGGAWLAGAVVRAALELLPGEPIAAPSAAWLGTGTAALLLTSPAIAWLGGKLLGEVPGLILAALALWAWLRGAPSGGRRAGWVALAVAAHAAAVCARPNFGVLAPALLLALATLPHTGAPGKRRMAWAGVAIFLGTQAAAHVVQYAVSGVGWSGFAGYAVAFAAGSRSIWVSALGALAGVGALLPLALVAGGSKRRGALRLFLFWEIATAVPSLAVAGLYQIEARYLIAPMVPLAALAALGVEVLFEAVRRHAGSRAAIRGVAVASGAAWLSANALALSVLPYEIDRRDLDGLLEAPELVDGTAPLLVPWAYSDYHYLVTLAPSRPIYFVHVPREDGELVPYDAAWEARIRRWYGARALLSPDELAPLLAAGPVYYLAWGIHPPLEVWSQRLDAVGLAAAAERVRGLGGAEHGDQSWIAERPELRRTLARRAGIYRLERVESAIDP